VDRSGRVAVFSGASDIGQGSTSLVAYIVCEELGVPLDHVRVLPRTRTSRRWTWGATRRA
jgi:CO/xanthine dehydrogenase Mo-binding subunit